MYGNSLQKQGKWSFWLNFFMCMEIHCKTYKSGETDYNLQEYTCTDTQNRTGDNLHVLVDDLNQYFLHINVRYYYI